MINENWIYLTILITGYGAFLYVKGVVQGRVQPNAVTWAILSLAPLIAGFSMLGQDVSLAGTVYTFLTGLWPLSIFASIVLTKHPRWKLTRFDMMCGILSLAGLMLWVSTGKRGRYSVFYRSRRSGVFADTSKSLDASEHRGSTHIWA